MEEFLRPRAVTQTKFASSLHVRVQHVNAIVKGRRAITAPVAILLAGALGTTPEFWMNIQVQHDLWAARFDPRLCSSARSSTRRRAPRP